MGFDSSFIFEIAEQPLLGAIVIKSTKVADYLQLFWQGAVPKSCAVETYFEHLLGKVVWLN